MKNFICIIKSHCEYPDFEWEGEAKNKDEAVKMLLRGGLGRTGWEYPEVAEHVREIDNNGNPIERRKT